MWCCDRGKRERVAADEKQYFCFRWQSKLTSTSDVFNSMTSSRHSISLLLDEDLLRRGEMFHFCWLCFSVSICVKIDFFFGRIYIKYYCLFHFSTVIHSNNAFIIINLTALRSLPGRIVNGKLLDSRYNISLWIHRVPFTPVL